MKRSIKFILLALLCIALVACGGSDEHIGEVRTPSSSSIMEGKNYLDVVESFEEAGFTNIKLEEIDDLVLGWLTKDGEVEEVTVGGNVDYSANCWVAADTEVIIRYHTFPEQEVEATQDDNVQNSEVKNEEQIVEEVLSTEETQEPIQTEEAVPEYTYTDVNKTMYASAAVNVRNLPVAEGDKIGALSLAQEVTVTGQCNETGWYRIILDGEIAFVSNNYLVEEKPAMEASAQDSANNDNSNSSESGSNSSSGAGQSVTVPSQEETTGNLVWVPTKGGTKYHSKSTCSNMDNPMQVSKETAIANGYTACKKCYK